MSNVSGGNIIGELTAESDRRMLDAAFITSRSYQELVSGKDYRFVVGRRGSGKSALFRKVSDALSNQPGVILLTEHPKEEKVIAFHDELARITENYNEVRHIARLTWRIQIVTDAILVCLNNYKAERLDSHAYFAEYKIKHQALFRESGLARGLVALRAVVSLAPVSAGSLPERLAEHFDLSRAYHAVMEALAQLKKRVVYVYDGLDEGWAPTKTATGLLGGLTKAAAELREAESGMHCLLFIRDNMLRSLAQLDGDYTRNIEGSTLRLHWDEDSLLQLVTRRLRVAFGWHDEQDIRVWNKFAQRGLEGKEGFRRCLQSTLYRPRDVIALINGAYQEASRADRMCIIDSDVEATATRISKTRLTDLCREYETVLPGLSGFTEAFRGQPAFMPFRQVREILEHEVATPKRGDVARDFALLNTADEAFNVLHSVGLLGVQDDSAQTVRFCHDGSNTDVHSLPLERRIVVHPCYWRALSVVEQAGEPVILRVDDEDDVAATAPPKQEMQDVRLRKLGRIVEELRKIPVGREGAHEFEDWVFTTSKYLFSKGLDNLDWKPNPGALQQRDIVGTNNGGFGFWKRMERDYDVGQFTIECKNFDEMSQDEFRQAWGYLNEPYGRCLMMVTRSPNDRISDSEKALVLEGWLASPRKLVFLMPAALLQRALSKMRSGNEQRDDYVNELLCKRLDVFERSYVSQKAQRHR